MHIFVFFFRRRSRRCLRTWCRLNIPTSSSSTSTGWTWRRVRHGYDVFHIYIHCGLSFSHLSHTFNTVTPAPPVALRLYSSQNTCHQAASSNFWRKPRKTTRPWMWRSVSVPLHSIVLILSVLWWWHRVLQSNQYSDPYFPQDYRLCNTAGSVCSDVYQILSNAKPHIESKIVVTGLYWFSLNIP